MSFADLHRRPLAAPLRSERRTPTPAARLRAWAAQERLDRQLAGGEAAAGDELAVRAWQLTRPRARVQVARALKAVLDEVESAVPRGGAAVPVRRVQVEAARDELVRAVARLRDPRPVRPRGIAMLRRLLADGDGPLYAPSADDELWRRVRRASIALD